ncbi:hypothetical protein SAMN04488540_12031 [Ferrimonas sediminum]|uniref:Uncharacterized protein n=2 Tax=Ferrimonas sediminum TaxID=718193 RepID=A0A1G8ZJM1_9GAMM|nr:hypothetical protein SAMN04488540_12031 [Ferrimonas sediminum]
MFLVSNYPQVPIVTTNPATDDVRQQELARAPVVPPREADKSASERALDPEHDRINQQKSGKLKRRHSDEDSSGEEGQQQHPSQSRPQFEIWRPPTFARPGVSRQGGDGSGPRVDAHPAAHLNDTDYQRFTRVIKRFYTQVAQPAEPSAFQVNA